MKRKGISPLIAAVLLIAFTMTIALLVGPFFTNIIQTSQEGQSDQAKKLVKASGTSLSIEDVAYDSDSGNYTVTVRNNGQNSIENYTAKVTGGDVAQKTFSKTLDPGEVQKFEISTSNKTTEDELSVEALNKPVIASKSLSSVSTGQAPASPSGLSLSS